MWSVIAAAEHSRPRCWVAKAASGSASLARARDNSAGRRQSAVSPAFRDDDRRAEQRHGVDLDGSRHRWFGYKFLLCISLPLILLSVVFGVIGLCNVKHAGGMAQAVAASPAPRSDWG